MLVLIVVLSAILRIVGLMPNIPYPDEAHIQVYSQNLAKNIMTGGNFDPGTFKYGSIIFYLNSFIYAAVAISAKIFQKMPFDLAVFKYGDLILYLGRLNVAFFGIGSVILMYFIGKSLFSRRVGILAALILAVAPMHVRDSHYMITDVIFLFFVLLAFLFIIKKKFFLSGFVAGVASTIRFFPIAFLPFPIILFRKRFNKIFICAGAAVLGIFVGVPYIFLKQNGLTLFANDLIKYALPWYSSGITATILKPLISQNIGLLYPPPEGFRPLHASWIFFNGIGPVPTILAIGGLLILLFKNFKKFLIVGIIPIVNFIYISFFVPAIYEKLSLPTTVFLALPAGFALEKFYKKKDLFFLILLIAIVPQLVKDWQASIACQEKYTQTQSSEWVDKNIPDHTELAYVSGATVPSTKIFDTYVELKPKENLSLEEARKLGADYVFINAGRLDYETYRYFNKYFVVPESVFENSYEFLALAEYQSRAKLLHKIDKPMMCETGRIYFYKLPPKLTPAKLLLTDQFDWQQIGSRLTSQTINSEPGKTYTFSFEAKSISSTPPKIFARIDFYQDRQINFSDQIKKALLLLNEGSTPIFYEKSREQTGHFDDKSIPGKLITLSPRIQTSNKWQVVTVSAIAPKDTTYLIVSIQNTSDNQTDILTENEKIFY